MEITGWGPTQEYIEKRRSLAESIIRSNATSFNRELVPGYYQKDRGLEASRAFYKLWAPYLFNEETEDIGYFQQLARLSQESKIYFPSEEKFSEILNEVHEKNIVPTVEILKKRKSSLNIEEYKTVLNNASILIFLLDFDNGLYSIREDYFIHKKSPIEIIERYAKELREFYRSWYSTYIIPSTRTYGIINLFLVDSLDNSLTRDMIIKNNPEKVLREEFPEKGLRRVLSKDISDKFLRIRNVKNRCIVNASKLSLIHI